VLVHSLPSDPLDGAAIKKTKTKTKKKTKKQKQKRVSHLSRRAVAFVEQAFDEFAALDVVNLNAVQLERYGSVFLSFFVRDRLEAGAASDDDPADTFGTVSQHANFFIMICVRWHIS
jgi:hypothetical protein